MTESLNDAVMPLMPASPGALIKAGRERAGIHLAVLSVNLKVSIKQLEALEGDQFESLSGPVLPGPWLPRSVVLSKLIPILCWH